MFLFKKHFGITPYRVDAINDRINKKVDTITYDWQFSVAITTYYNRSVTKLVIAIVAIAVFEKYYKRWSAWFQPYFKP